MKTNIHCKFHFILTLILLGCCSPAVFGQLTGVKNIPGDYATISAAVTSLNISGVGTGGVTFNILGGYTETITTTIALAATGTAANPIVFQKDPASRGVNPLITAYTNGTYTPSSATQDGIWRLSGSDYVTIDAIDVRDNPANVTNPSTMEYGYALYKANTSNGCQYVTIKNCTITLSNINNAAPVNPMTDGSAGIIVMNAGAASANAVMAPVAGGTNSNNQFYGNLIQNCNIGIAIIGHAATSPFTIADTNNDIGGSSAATGNTIINFGGASGAVNPAAAIRTLNQYDLKVSYNTINSNNGSGTNHPAILRGIFINTATSANATITYNTVTVKGAGSTQNIAGIENVAGSTPAGNTINISNNTITNSTYSTATTGGFFGIYNNLADPATLIINNNTISGNTFAASTSGFFYGIFNGGAASTVSVNNNSITGNTASTLSTGLISGISNTAPAPVLNINSNILADNSISSAVSVYSPIYNSGDVTTTLNINANNIGTSTLPAVNFTVANSGVQLLINNTKGTVNAALSISNNNFYNVLYSTQGTGPVTLISNTATTASLAINNNIFTNLNVNTTGGVTFISTSAVVGASGTHNINSNSISGTFTKAAGGTVTLFTSSAASASGGVVNNNNNNFSNITVTGGTGIAGWVNTDAGFAIKTIQNNTFSNWVAGTGTVNAMNINISSASNATTGNLINNISGGGVVTGIVTGTGNDKIFSNIINTLSSTGANGVTGISVTGGTAKHIYSNKIYDLQSNNAGGSVNGISVSGSTVVTANIYNNLIGDLRTPVANTSTDVLRGINITATAVNATINVYNNTVHLNGSSTGTNFSSTGIYHAASATSTTAVLNLRNNIISNTSIPKGSGITVAFRRSASALNNYASTSNNNLFYAGAPATNRLVLYDGTNLDQTLSVYKNRVTARDAQSVTEDLTAIFLSTSGASASFLHLNPAKATQAESGGIAISGLTTDFDGAIRQGNAGYSGTGTAPDIGADEMEGIRATAFTGTYSVGVGQTYTSLTNTDGLFSALNSLGLSGNVVVNVTSDLEEDGSNSLYPWAEQGIGNYTVTLQPNAATVRTIAGNVAGPLIRLNGSKRFIIDGSYSGSGKYLTFRNTNTAGTTGTAFTFINGASNNTLRFSNIEAFTNATNGVILFSTSTATGGNSNNLISNCNINATVSGNTGILCIYSLGTSTAGFANTANTLSGNNIFNYRDRAIDITSTGSTAWIISGNSFYNGDITAAINYAASSTIHTIRIAGGSGYAVLNNYIGGNASGASGTAAVYASNAGLLTYQGILITTSAATPVSNIKGNTIANISMAAVPVTTTTAGSNMFMGIETNGSGINIGGPLTGEGNTIGSNTLNGSILITTTTALTTNRSNIRGINCASTGGQIIGNQVGGIDFKNIGAGPGPSQFIGIYINNATPPSLVNNNIIGSTGTGAASNSIRVLPTSLSATTTLTGISISGTVTATLQLNGNLVKNVSFQHTNATTSITGILNGAITTAAVTINNNTITGNTVSTSPAGIVGINSGGTLASLTISNNTISANASAATTTGYLYGIYTSGAPGAITVSNNTFSGNSTTALTTGVFAGIYNTATPTSLNITGNTFYGNTTTSTSGSFYAVYNSGAVTTTINLNANNIGTSTSAAITFNSANSGTQYIINNTGGGANAALSISNNNFLGISYVAAGTGNDFLILNSAATLSQSINGNTFTNLNVNTSGNVTFLSDNVVVSATGTQSVNNNSISGTFTKRAAGIVTLFTSSTANSLLGSSINHSSNNFSNITVTGATTIAGWVNTDAGESNKIIQNNTFTNWSGGTSSVTAMSVNVTGTVSAVSGNVINNISSLGAVTGISTAAGNANIYSNIINTMSTTGAAAVVGIAVTAGITKNIYKNKIYDLSGSNASAIVNGILVSGGTTVNVYNNLIGDLRTPAANSASDVIRGINITSVVSPSNINIYFNTIYLNAASTGAAFSTTGIYHTANATSTIGALNLRNNSITNTSTPRGSGTTVVLRRSGTALNNYGAASNNNLLYAGSPASNKLVYFDGTNADQTIAAFKTRVSTRDAQSVTENISGKFLSTTGSSSVFLHMDATQPTLIESGAVNITGLTDDFDGQVRAGNTGYSGSSTTPDIGADEVFGIEVIPPVITYTLLDNATSSTNRNVTGVTITDASGISSSAGTKPRIYYKRFNDANVWLDNTSTTNGWKYSEATNSTSPFTFTIDYSRLYGGSAATAGVIQYFIVAQDLATISNVAINSGSFAAMPASVSLNSAAFPIAGTINSYIIPFSGTYNIGSTEVFTSLTKADGLFAAINSAGLMGNAIFNITSDITEDGANALNQWTESGAGNYHLTIQPDGTTGRTVSGNVAAGLIRLNGADRVTIDGSNSGSGSYLNFINTSPSGTTGTAFTLVNGASNNVIRYCDVEAFANSTNGVILFGTSAVAGGNSNNTIDYCTINATVASNTGSVGIYSAGTTGYENASNTISNNNIFNYKDRGLDISAAGSSSWIISGNSFYNGDVTGIINYPASSVLHGIRILGGAGYTIVNNYIGGDDMLASGQHAVYASTLGGLSFGGIVLATSNASPASVISGNTITSITVATVPTAANSYAFTGIETSGSGITIGGSTPEEGNIIGSATTNGSIAVTTATASATYSTIIAGINCTSAGGTVSNNQVSSFDISNAGASPAPSLFRGIYINNASAPTQVNNNLIGSNAISNSIHVLPASASATLSVTGIELGTAVNNAVEINGNMIDNIGHLSSTSSGSFTGINNTATLSGAVITISNDTIQNISSGANSHSGSTIYSGIASRSASTIHNNLISNITLSASGTNAQVRGITVSGNYTHTVSENLISGLFTTSQMAIPVVETGSPASAAIIGMLNEATAAGQVINNNRFALLTATSGAAVNVVVTAIAITSTGSGNIYNNKFGTCTNLATGAGPGLCHIMAAGGSFNVYNNVLRISNLTNTNGMKVYGIVHSSGNSWNYFHNTIRVGGNSTGTALRSAAFISSANSAPVLKNNILFNIRTGTGVHYAISNLGSPPSTWPATTSDYNDLYSINSNIIGEWGNGASQTFAQWKNLSGGDAHSISNAISFITSPYDLEPDSISNCNFNNAGTPITTPVLINTDLNSNPRNLVNPDLGAYEFNYTGFTIIAGNNSPVCSGSNVLLSVDPGEAISPDFIWKNPSGIVISTLQNPVVIPVTGQYKITVTDSTGCFVTDSTLVMINPRPTATLSAMTSVCDNGTVNLNITVTGTGTISGTLSNGLTFSGTAPLIVVPLSVSSTTSFSITALSDANCTAVSADIPDTVTITVTHKGDWLGITSNWNNPVNWCEGIIPTSSVDVTIPAGTLIMPILTDSGYCKQLTIETGNTLTISATGVLNIAGTLNNNGVYLDNGTTRFNGTTGQQTFSGVTVFNNLTLANTSSLLLPAAVIVNHHLTISSGIFIANNFNVSVAGNWINNVAAAFTAGTGTVTFNGTTVQSIGGAFATTFNHLTIANTGSTVSLLVNAGIAGNLSVSGGTFDLGIFTANRLTAGGTLTIANNATLKIGGTNIFPVNYVSNTLLVASTVEYSGTNQTVANQLYGNLTLSSSAGAAVKTSSASALVVVGNFATTLGLGSSVTFNAAAAITVNNNVTIGASTTFNAGSYSHTIGGNWVNNGTFNGNTGTLTFTGAGTAVSGSGLQNFNNLTVAASGVSFSNNSITVAGNLATTGSGSFTQATGGTLLMSGTGKTISGSGISLMNLTVSGSVSTANALVIAGNLAVSGSFAATGGTITMSGAAKTISGAGTISFAILDPAGSITTNADFSISSALIVDGSLTASAGTATFTGTSSISGTANLYHVAINGTSLQLATGSVMGVAGTLTIISGTLDVINSAPNTVNFNGTGAQNVNSITYSNLVLSNGNTKTAVGAVITNADITIQTGTTFNPSTYTHTVYRDWINNGTFTAGTCTVQFLGAQTSNITGATTFNVLTENTNIVLKSNVSAATVNMTSGTMLTGTNTLTITGTRTGSAIIIGNIKRTHTFTTGVAYAFEGPQNTVTFSAVSGVSSITVSVAKGVIPDFPFGGSISRVYDIAIPAGTYTATLRLHYEDDELNGNDESSMALWHHNGTAWNSSGKMANDTTINYVEQSGLTNITNRWTVSDDGNIVQWNGSVSTDWNTAANWTVLQGAGSRPPASADIVDLGITTFLNQPAISNSVTVKNIIFGSVKAVVLTLGSGGSLTTSGISGTWTGNATHTIHVNNQNLTVDGNFDLSDGVTSHAINLNIGTGNVTVLGSLTQSGGANIVFSGAGTMNVYQNFNHANGLFTAASGTVIYNGTENQDVADIGYYHLTINKTAGLAAINNSVTIAGNLVVMAGELDNFSNTNVAGNVTINPGGTLKNYQTLHVQGNWSNTGTYTATGSSIYFDGNGQQNISASTFGNLNINKPSGTATLTGNVTLTGDLNLTSGILDFQTFDCNRNLPGGTTTHANGATLMIGANNPPKNFSSHILSPASITIFYGPATQVIDFPGIAFGHLIFRGTGAKVISTNMTVLGDLTIDSLTNVDFTTSSVTLLGNWINNGTFTPSTSTVQLNGISRTVTGVTIFNKVTVQGSYTLLNNTTFNDLLTITSTGSLSGGSSIYVTMVKDLINRGILYALGTTTFTGTVLQTLSLINAVQTVALTVNFNGTVSPVLNSTSPPQYGFLNINNTGGINASVGYTILYALNVGSGASFNGGSSTHNIYGSVTNNGTITSSGTLNFTPATATTVNLGSNFSSTGRVIFAGTGAMTLAGTGVSFNNIDITNANAAGITPPANWNIAKDLTIAEGSILNAGNHDYHVGGNILNKGAINSSTSTFFLNGSSLQEVRSPSAFTNFTINKASGLTTLTSDIRVNGLLNFVSGNIQTANNILSLPQSGTVAGASQNTGWVNGKLQKYVAIGARSTAKNFEVGDSVAYTPISIVFSNVSTGGDITASATRGDHPNLGISPINTSKSVNRFWNITNYGLVSAGYTADFHFLATDMDAGSDTSRFQAGIYNGSSWSMPVTAARSDTNVMVTGVTTYGDFAVGEVCYAGTAISYVSSPYCTNAGTALVTHTGTIGGVYSSTPGLAIDAATGSVDLLSSTPGTYNVTYTIAAGNGCRTYPTTTTIIVSGAPLAVIAYAGSPYCSTVVSDTVSISGTSGGIYSSSAGLSINANTGAVAISSSSAGTYTVIYTIASANGCSQYQTTTNITISNPASATINYNGSPYCGSSRAGLVSQTGTTGGKYSSTAGLSIDSITGTITMATSMAGMYTVSYSIAPVNGCGLFTTTTTVSINEFPVATISYTGSPFCTMSGLIPIVFSGTTGGKFSSTAGLSIDTATGEINTGASTAGTYIVNYTVAPAGGCGQYSTTTSVTLAVSGTWTGAVSDDWNVNGNWLCGAIPISATDVTLPGGLLVYPVIISGTNDIHNLIIQSGASLAVNNATFRISGSINNSGLFNANSGTIVLNGTAAQTIPAATFYGNSVTSLRINNPAGVIMEGPLSVTNALTIVNGSLASNGYLTLKSTATATARVAAITSPTPNPISGNVTVERYIPGRRKYRLITSPVTTSAAASLTAGQENLSIWANWQNSGSTNTPNTGTFITGGTVNDGFDIQTPAASLFTYDDVNRKFVGFTSPNGKNTKYTPLKAGVPYYMFVYGDRTNTLTTSSPNSTVLRATGTLLTGDQAYTTNSAIPLSPVTGRFTFLGNPFASPINWATIPKTNLENAYWGWDPNLSSTGGFITVLTTGTVTLLAPYSGNTGLNQYIQPGQGFFVRTAGASPTLTIREQDKVSNFNGNAFRVNGAGDVLSLIAINLQYANGSTNVLADGVLAAFSPAFSNSVSSEDGFKLANSTENIAILHDTTSLSIDARQLPKNNDTLFLNVSKLTKPQYILQIFTEELVGKGIVVYLQDRYLNTLQPLTLTDTNNIVFQVNPTIAASFDVNRFRLVFRTTGAALPVSYTSIRAVRKEEQVAVAWEMGDQSDIKRYEIERGAEGQQFVKVGEVTASGSNGRGSYQWMDTQPLAGSNYYRVRAVQSDGSYLLSKVVLVMMTKEPLSVSVYPNPVKNGRVTLHCDWMSKGLYTVVLLNAKGEQVIRRELRHGGGMLDKVLYFDRVIAAGLYYLELRGEGWKYSQVLMVE